MLLLNKGKVVNEHHCNFQFVREKTSVNWFSHVLLFWREKAGNAIIKSCVFSLYSSMSCNNATPTMDRGFV